MAAKGFFLGVIFLCELAALAAYGYWGLKLPAPLLVKGAVMLGLPIAVALVWGLFLAPKASYPVSPVLGLSMKTLVFGFAAMALHAAGKSRLAAAFVACAVIAHAAEYVLERVQGSRIG
ncbi:uncharacterized protein DUF2568 [Paenibacillus methanolicus]|uniref:Uncharacterized protein DUF2568 n=2 Tax=Paenibacillus methanolicus TaxID=582686 RepID=A0A5S5C9W6_9BACL|nr:uncharacterized protein DUF2568 [Paenibacillus methanolicus]